MHIVPNSTIKLLKNVPLDNTYRDSIYFTSASAQATYFSSLAQHTLTAYSYQRKEKAVIRVGIASDSCYDCNYLMYQNTSHGSRWFYAFITGVEYINESTTEITFELDVLQTWYFDYDLEYCFVERETVADDTVGKHTLPESVDIGGFYRITDFTNLTNWSEYSAVVISPYQDAEGETSVTGRMMSGMYSGCEYHVLRCTDWTDVSGVNDYLSAMVNANQVNSIVGILYVPSAIVDGDRLDAITATYEIIKQNTTLGSYTPRNNKLLTFPYNALYVSNSLGDFQLYRWEEFGDTENDRSGYVELKMLSEFSCNPEVCLYPYNYMRNNDDIDYDNGLSITQFPQCSFNYDVFRAWVANGGALKSALGIASSALGVVASVIGENPIGAAHSALGIGNQIADIAIQSIQPNGKVGTQQGTTMTSNRKLNFYTAQAYIRPEVARTIDDYFDVYGYYVARRKIPNRKNRTHWTYLKTRDCCINGSVPADDMRKICSIYDSGITWWVNGSEVGKYNLTNSELS